MQLNKKTDMYMYTCVRVCVCVSVHVCMCVHVCMLLYINRAGLFILFLIKKIDS